MRTVVVGNRALARHVLRHLVETDWMVVGVVEPSGRAASRQANFESMAELAERHDLDRITTPDINDAETRDRLAALDPDLCVCPGWHQIIGQSVLDVPTEGFVGFHSSPLPRGRGGAPVNWSLIHGEESVTISLFYYTTGVDAGDVLSQRAVPVEPRDDVSTVFDRLAVAACDAIDDVAGVLRDGRGRGRATAQSLAEATYRPRRQPQDGLVDWEQSPGELVNWIRAQTHPYPGAYTFFDRTRLRIWDATVPAGGDRSDGGGDAEERYDPGTVLAVVPGRGIDVATGGGVVRLTRIQAGTRPERWADEVARNRSGGLSIGDRLGRHHAPDDWLYTGVRDADDGTRYETNLARGETAKLSAVLDAPNGDRRVSVAASVDGETVVDRTVRVRGRVAIPVSYGANETGTSTLELTFEEDDERVDTRYLKFFVTD